MRVWRGSLTCPLYCDPTHRESKPTASDSCSSRLRRRNALPPPRRAGAARAAATALRPRRAEQGRTAGTRSKGARPATAPGKGRTTPRGLVWAAPRPRAWPRRRGGGPRGAWRRRPSRRNRGPPSALRASGRASAGERAAGGAWQPRRRRRRNEVPECPGVLPAARQVILLSVLPIFQ